MSLQLVKKQLDGLNDWGCSSGNRQESPALCPLHTHPLLHAWVLLPPVSHRHGLLCLVCSREEVGSAVFSANLNSVSTFYVSCFTILYDLTPSQVFTHARRRSHKAGTDTLSSMMTRYLWI